MSQDNVPIQQITEFPITQLYEKDNLSLGIHLSDIVTKMNQVINTVNRMNAENDDDDTEGGT